MAQTVRGMDADAKLTGTYLQRVWANYRRMAAGSKAKYPGLLRSYMNLLQAIVF
ncbi:MAG: hypothetical protein P8Y45_05485 [Exilibacterium sp.]